MIVTTITPRVSETDGAGHINNTAIPVWLEAGRREIFALFTPDLGFEHWGVALDPEPLVPSLVSPGVPGTSEIRGSSTGATRSVMLRRSTRSPNPVEPRPGGRSSFRTPCGAPQNPGTSSVATRSWS